MDKKITTDFYIVKVDALPDVFTKVMEAKRLLESGKVKNIQTAVSTVGISRSAYYKYKDSVHPFYENTRGKTVTFSINLDDTPGILSDVLDRLANLGANILTINQTIPLNHIANVTITIETGKMLNDNYFELFESLQKIQGVQSLNIIARE